MLSSLLANGSAAPAGWDAARESISFTKLRPENG
jgi:hypothetical protein